MRQAFAKGFWMGSARAGMMTVTGGRAPRKALPTEPDSEQELLRSDRAASFPAPDGKLTFDKLSSVFLSGNQTRDDAPSHIRVAKRVPREVAELWVNMCPAHVYEIGREDAGKVEVVLTPSNCVQCGAITAKGGRLLPAEGGAGPEYSLT
jgi:electron-transferring-flavoprotein dehydrogenase